MFSALKRLAGRSEDVCSTTRPGLSTMSANLQRKFAKGVQYNMKIVIKGDRNVGKTCLFHRLQGKKFIEEYIPTEEIQVASIHWNYKATDDVVKVEVWDVVDRGRKKKTFDGLKLNNASFDVPEEAALDAEFLDVYKGANGVILVLDITKNWTFEYVQRELLKIPKHIPVIILANHCDMSHHRTVTADHVSFYVDNLDRGSNSAQVRYGEASMRNGFGLKLLHKFFNLPFLQLQKETLLGQLERNRMETESTNHELNVYMESDDANYDSFLDNLVNKRRQKADLTSPTQLPSSQSFHELESQSQQPPPRSMSINNELGASVKPKPPMVYGASYPLPIDGVGASNIIANVCKSNGFISVGEQSRVPAVSASINISSQTKDVKQAINGSNSAVVPSVEEFVPEEVVDASFLDDDSSRHDTPQKTVEAGSESDVEDGNPLVADFQDDLDPEDQLPQSQPRRTQDCLSSSQESLDIVLPTSEDKSDLNQDITAEALDTWISSDIKWRGSPEGEDSNSEHHKPKDTVSIDSSQADNSLLENKVKKKKKKSKDKENEEKPKKSKKKVKETSDKKKRGSRKSRDESGGRDELEEFLNGSATTPCESTYEAL